MPRYVKIVIGTARGRCRIVPTESQQAAELPATQVAQWFVLQAQGDPEQDLSNLKLQKLVYLAQSRYLHETGRALLREVVQAWDHGPVVQQVYRQFSAFGSQAIRLAACREPELAPEVVANLECVWTYFGGYTASKLRAITHAVGPWPQHFREGARNIVLPNDEIANSWTEFERYAEPRIVATTDDYKSTLARYSSILRATQRAQMQEDGQGIRRELGETRHMRRSAARAMH
ncbi:DUF4065 domain-containing protein [Arthrobacter terricola]|uniref:DUF4065 domain-containing protein n=1 Tax=Arthrobacter terricola TaxID=2547396 RepID=A0A4R5KYS7_9MICC|nr:DUF4065 domain-containing protein [Arthrobacter terricola]